MSKGKGKRNIASEAQLTPRKHGLFMRFSRWTAYYSGHPVTFSLALSVVLVWALSGPVFGFSDTWQLIINTGTTIVTFLMVFLIQNTQNRDSEAMHIKIDELIRATSGARNALMNLEDMDTEELDKMRAEYMTLAEKTGSEIESRKQRGEKK